MPEHIVLTALCQQKIHSILRIIFVPAGWIKYGAAPFWRVAPHALFLHKKGGVHSSEYFAVLCDFNAPSRDGNEKYFRYSPWSSEKGQEGSATVPENCCHMAELVPQADDFSKSCSRHGSHVPGARLAFTAWLRETRDEAWIITETYRNAGT